MKAGRSSIGKDGCCIKRWSCLLEKHVGGLISFASTVIFLFTLDIWIKPVLCSRMVSLFHHTSPWTRRCLQSSPSAHRNGRDFRRSVQTACCYWLLNRGKKFLRLKFTDECKPFMVDQFVDVSTVRRWVRRFKDGELGQADLSDKNEVQGLWPQVISFMKIALKNWPVVIL